LAAAAFAYLSGVLVIQSQRIREIALDNGGTGELIRKTKNPKTIVYKNNGNLA